MDADWGNGHYSALSVLSFTGRGRTSEHEIKRFFLRSFFSARNLLLCKRKNHPGRWFFEG